MPERESSRGENTSSLSQTKTFQERVEEFKLWSDDQNFKSQEYERRRNEKIQKKGLLRVDKLLNRARSLYLPSAIGVVFGTVLLLYSAVNRLGEEDSSLINKHVIIKTLGGLVTGLGLLTLMATAAYTYHRENKVRRRNGYPTLFESTRAGGGGALFGVHQNENLAVTREFVDRRRTTEFLASNRSPGIGIQVVSGEEITQLVEPSHVFVSSQQLKRLSSVNPTLTWLDKHGSYFHELGPQLKRQSSDSVLDQSFARSITNSCAETSFIADVETMEYEPFPNDAQCLDANENRAVKQELTNRTEVQIKNYKASIPLLQHRTKDSNILFNIEQYSESVNSNSGRGQCKAQYNLENKELYTDNPGVSICSTDSSGYTSSDFYHLVEKEYPRDISKHKKHKLILKPKQCHAPYSPTGSTVTHREQCGDTQTSEERCHRLMQQHSCKKAHDALRAPVPEHVVCVLEEDDGASLLPPVSPDISTLPYLRLNLKS
ncbi:hypothetical protein ElyMa_002363300 [Elysia marginata]|uniref:Uncharacterized protein n=1 Tax=Elysia marginata TaxID=1093978 RepID=A0AAV4GAR2_9GAST|nr:hypothetical protein ElyMa_002363300 [Elysia marginata]